MNRTFTRIAWLFTAYLIGVILFGAWVRITHSGAGCGAHWPLCDGEIIPSAPSTEKLIEYTHRLTSGLCGIFGIAITAWAWRLFGLKGKATIASAITLLFIIIEGAIGAGLVLAELVADDTSVARATVISLHLTNTLMLTASAAATAYFAKNPDAPVHLRHAKGLLIAMIVGALVFPLAARRITPRRTLMIAAILVGVGFLQSGQSLNWEHISILRPCFRTVRGRVIIARTGFPSHLFG